MRYLLIFILIFSVASAQNEANIWYFGFQAGLDFNNGSPVLLTDSAMNAVRGCASIADVNGQLLFYTNGETVWNKNHQIMVNGINLQGEERSPQNSVIIPYPGNDNKYIIFTNGPENVIFGDNENGLLYSEVDMTLDNGLGAVTAIKNIPLVDNTTGHLAAVQHQNGTDFWVTVQQEESNEYYTYLLNSSGVSTTPVISTVGSMTILGKQLKFSPNGKKIAAAKVVLNPSTGDEIPLVEFYDFDASTGVITNAISITPFPNADVVSSLSFGTDYGTYGIEFSCNSKVVYAYFNFRMPLGTLYTKRLVQYDISSNNLNDILASEFTIANFDIDVEPLSNDVNIDRLGSFQLAPDGKIYIARWEDFEFGQDGIDVINNPNELGAACNYQIQAIENEGTSAMGLPSFVSSFLRKVNFEFTNSCVDEQVLFTLILCEGYNTINWDFGDGNTSNLENPNHTYSSAGTFSVTLTVTLTDNQVQTVTKDITISPIPVVTPVVELRQCDDDIDGFVIFNLNEANAEISANFQNENIAFFESLDSAQSNLDPIPNPTAYINQTVSSDTIWARVESSFGCVSTSQINLLVTTTIAEIPDEFIICEGIPLLISLEDTFDEYLWSTGETTQEIIITEPGTYDVSVTRISDGISCQDTTSFEVKESNPPTILDVEIEDWRRDQNSITIIVEGLGDYEYSINGINYQDSNFFSNLTEDEYTVYVREKNGCGEVLKRIFLLDYPDFFTPNNDGFNDRWRIINSNKEVFSKIFIFDRYGKLLVELSPTSAGWDGTYQGKPMPSNDYWFRYEREDGNSLTGHFTLKR